MTSNPADAVREALDELIELSYDDGSIQNDERSQSVTNARAKVLDMFAALAGAGPDWVTVPRTVTREMLIAYWNSDCEGDPAVTDSLLTDGDLAVLQRDWNAMLAAAPTAPHAPAKAREVTDADVERAFSAAEQAALRGDGMYTDGGPIRAQIRAALATFAEGAE